MRNVMGRSFNKMQPKKDDKEEEEEEEETLPFAAAAAAATVAVAANTTTTVAKTTTVASSSSYYYLPQKHAGAITTTTTAANKRKSTLFSCSVSGVWILRLRSVLAAVIAAGGRRSGRSLTAGLPRTVAGTLFGRRRGHVRLAFQADPRSPPALLLELAAPTAALVREMASGLVRIALECDRASPATAMTPPPPLLEEPSWRAYCNGRKCGPAVRRECGDADRVVLRAVEAVSVGAGVLPAGAVPGEGDEDDEEDQGDVMYMRAKFERVVGSSDSAAFYMISPDGTSGGPELSIYLLRV